VDSSPSSLPRLRIAASFARETGTHFVAEYWGEREREARRQLEALTPTDLATSGDTQLRSRAKRARPGYPGIDDQPDRPSRIVPRAHGAAYVIGRHATGEGATSTRITIRE
jgi:hypothetical protein